MVVFGRFVIRGSVWCLQLVSGDFIGGCDLVPICSFIKHMLPKNMKSIVIQINLTI